MAPLEMSNADQRAKTVLRIHLDEVVHPATATFISLVDCAKVLPNAVQQVIHHLYSRHGREHIPQVRSVTLILRSMGGVAYTTGLQLDDLHKEIHLSLEYLGHQLAEPLRFRNEAIGVITHEMVHCFQHNCQGTAPGALIEGIADYVRLKAGLAPPHWKKSRQERGNKWDEGYQKTAWFLEWLEQFRGPGTVSFINETMRQHEYKENVFWNEIFGESVESLWKKYTESWEDETGREDKVPESGSGTDTEPEVLDLDESEKEEAAKEERRAHEFHS